MKFPKIDFNSDHWPVNSLYRTDQRDWRFSAQFIFQSRDHSFNSAVRCLVAETLIQNSRKVIDNYILAFRLLKNLSVPTLSAITLKDLREIEEECVKRAQEHAAAAAVLETQLRALHKQIQLLSDKGVIPHLGFHLRKSVRQVLRRTARDHMLQGRSERSLILDRKIEALNDAFNALHKNDPRLDPADRVAIALTVRMMCAPSRVNEVVCSSIEDYVLVDDYTQKTEKTIGTDKLQKVHQMLLITMKGSKGAQWSAKPALNFMIDAFNYTTEIIKQHGERSRMLIQWYQNYPSTLYLPPELEHLRGQDLTVENLSKIVNLSDSATSNAAALYFVELKHKIVKAANPKSLTKSGRSTPRSTISFLPFKDVEKFLLRKIHLAISNCRKVTIGNHYSGDLAKMLFLFDRLETPFLPSALSYKVIRRRLKAEKDASKKCPPHPTAFMKLGITMPINGQVQTAEIETHDARRWLTTQALRYGEELSDVLINKWANRLSLAQLRAYDLRSDEELASFSRMPSSNELEDISKGIAQAKTLRETYGLKSESEFVTALDANVSITSMNAVMQAVQDRPIARTSEQIIILYPSQYGVCLHQHHETPCRNYDSCLPCDNNVVVKGHSPTNEKIRLRSAQLRRTVINQFERLVREHNREIADDPGSLARHMLTLIKKGLSPEKMAEVLIDEFHEIKNLLKDKLLAKRLEEAFVAAGFVNRLDNEEVPSGALIRYHNPAYHAAPGLEKALESHGGRAKVALDEQLLVEKHPQFSAVYHSLTDERSLLKNNDDYDEDAN